jgi:hypothetical protein
MGRINQCVYRNTVWGVYFAVPFITHKKLHTLQPGKQTHQTFSGKVTVVGSLKCNAYIQPYCLCVWGGGISIKMYYVWCVTITIFIRVICALFCLVWPLKNLGV